MNEQSLAPALAEGNNRPAVPVSSVWGTLQHRWRTVQRVLPVSQNVRIFLRGWLIVTLTSANVRQIAAGNYAHAFLVGYGISLVWWHNSRNAAKSDGKYAGWIYGLGAGVGTLTGMYLGR